MNYMYSITSKDWIAIPKESGKRLVLDEIGMTAPGSSADVRAILTKPSFKDDYSESEQLV